MANIKFTGYWSQAWQKEFHIPKGYIIIKPKEIYNKQIAPVLIKLQKKQEEKQELRELDINIEFHYQKRNLDQNALMWSLYEIESNEMNGNQSGRKEDNITGQNLYDQDLIDFGARIEMKVSKEEYFYIKSQYRVIEKEFYDDKSNTYYIKAIVSTSHFTTHDMARWIERIFNRLAQNGVTIEKTSQIRDYWIKWRNSLNDSKILLNGEENLTKEDYKNSNPSCEACGGYIQGAGEISHIKAGHHDEFDFPWNWLHLCHACHIGLQHQKGWSDFLKLNGHLKFKVETALKKEI
jgi:hypothetical protein